MIGWYALPRDRARSDEHRLDGFGALLLGAGVVFVMLPLIEASSSGVEARLVAASHRRASCWSRFFAWEHRLESRGGMPLLSPKLAGASAATPWAPRSA